MVHEQSLQVNTIKNLLQCNCHLHSENSPDCLFILLLILPRHIFAINNENRLSLIFSLSHLSPFFISFIYTVFQKYQAARSSFAQEIADLAGRPECVEQLMQENVIYILKGLLTDVSLSIQQNAATAVGKLASHSPEIAELLDKEDVLRTLVYVNIERPHVCKNLYYIICFLLKKCIP